jgi:hypothetical protein
MPPPKSPDRSEPDHPLGEVSGHKPGDFIERDLWELDDEWDTENPPVRVTPVPEPIPADDPESTAPSPTLAAESTAPEPDDLPPLEPPPPITPGDAPAGSEDLPAEPPAAGPPASPSSGSSFVASELAPATAPEAAEPPPAATPRRPRFTLRKLELGSLLVVIAMLLGGGAWVLKTFFDKIPTRPSRVEMPSFPVAGQALKVTDAATFWRAPIRGGPNADSAKPNIRLIPVLELTAAAGGGQGALRVFFRDSTGTLVGDSVTTLFAGGTFPASGNNRLQLAATSGFGDEGDYAAYQTAETDPWTVEVFEGPEERAPFDAFRLIFRMPVSPARR